jgi:hypothetical protein
VEVLDRESRPPHGGGPVDGVLLQFAGRAS